MQKGNTYHAKQGNIKTMVTSLLNTEEAALPTLQNNYTYDQLNRIVNYDGYTASGLAYHTDYSYDRNGNLKTLSRKVGNNHFDKLGYRYTPNTNQLTVVSDTQGNQPATSGIIDLPNQVEALRKLNIDPNKNPTHNYIYDAIGQLVEDRTEGLRINWRVDGKVASISKGHHTTTTNDDVVIQFHYDGLGNRISKETLKAGEATQQTYYTRDAQGNVMAVYGEGGTTTVVKDTPAELTVGEVAHTETDIYARNHITSTTTIADKQTLNFTAGQSITLSPGFEAKQGSNATLKIGDVPATTSKEGEEVAGVFLKEHHIYGSSRLGILTHNKLIIAENPEATNEPTGKKNYELTNHLGNVLSVISDERNGNKPDVIAFNDYYPFGMLLPNRHDNSDKYRYGFQGQEKDDEIKGEGNSFNYKYRMHDPRVGRFFAVDPMEPVYGWYSPYVFSGNRVIDAFEMEGLQPFIKHKDKTAIAGVQFKVSNSSKISGKVIEEILNRTKLKFKTEMSKSVKTNTDINRIEGSIIINNKASYEILFLPMEEFKKRLLSEGLATKEQLQQGTFVAIANEIGGDKIFVSDETADFFLTKEGWIDGSETDSFISNEIDAFSDTIVHETAHILGLLHTYTTDKDFTVDKEGKLVKQISSIERLWKLSKQELKNGSFNKPNSATRILGRNFMSMGQEGEALIEANRTANILEGKGNKSDFEFRTDQVIEMFKRIQEYVDKNKKKD